MAKKDSYDKNFDKRFWDCVSFCEEYPLVVDVIMKSIIEGKKVSCSKPGKCEKFPCSCLVCDDN